MSTRIIIRGPDTMTAEQEAYAFECAQRLRSQFADRKQSPGPRAGVTYWRRGLHDATCSCHWTAAGAVVAVVTVPE